MSWSEDNFQFASHDEWTLYESETPKAEGAEEWVVYEVPCASYNYVYIGETGRNLMERIKKHKYAVRTINT